MDNTQIHTMENPNQIAMYLKDIFGKAMLSKKDLCEFLDISSATLNRRIKENRDIPSYVKLSDSKTAKVQFPIFSVAEYYYELNHNAIKVSTND
ncbi:MAG: hypothetical protein NTW78_06730 [Campylobacterales bacterium]|nr:hypothetical protein [Campylobacterales bacterium]